MKLSDNTIQLLANLEKLGADGFHCSPTDPLQDDLRKLAHELVIAGLARVHITSSNLFVCEFLTPEDIVRHKHG
jgi:hypothetical protein